MFLIELVLSAVWAAALFLTFLFHWKTVTAICAVLLVLFALAGLISRPSRRTP